MTPAFASESVGFAGRDTFVVELDKDEDDEVAEDAQEEGHLGDEAVPDRSAVLRFEAVDEREADAEGHLRHAEDNAYLHLERVEEGHLYRQGGSRMCQQRRRAAKHVSS